MLFQGHFEVPYVSWVKKAWWVDVERPGRVRLASRSRRTCISGVARLDSAGIRARVVGRRVVCVKDTSLFLPPTARSRDLTCAHEVANVLLQELVVAVQLVMLLADGLDAVKNGDERFLKCLCMSVAWVSQHFAPLNLGSWVTHLRSSSRASFPILSISSLVRLGLMALTSSGPNSASTGPTAELSRGTTKGPLLLRLGSRGRVGMGW